VVGDIVAAIDARLHGVVARRAHGAEFAVSPLRFAAFERGIPVLEAAG
jgi:hypothetical protein